MGFLANLKGTKAHAAHTRGDYEKARKLYDEAYAGGLDDPKTLLTYSVLLLRSAEYDKALEVLRKLEKIPKLPPSYKVEMMTNYAIICYKKGNIARGVNVLRDLMRKNKTATLLGVYGYMAVEWAASGEVNEELQAFETTEKEDGTIEKTILTPAQEAKKVCEEGLDYDDVDPVLLDNIAQYYLRVEGDKEKALGYFKKALEYKPGAIDTNYFLALYDIENGDLKAAEEKLRTSLEGRFSPLNYATVEIIKEKLEEIGVKA